MKKAAVEVFTAKHLTFTGFLLFNYLWDVSQISPLSEMPYIFKRKILK